MAETILEAIYCFPFKGFPGHRIDHAQVEAGGGIPNDRRFAVTNGKLDTGEWMPARSFFINAIVDGMSKFKLEIDGNGILIRNVNGNTLKFVLDDQESLAVANRQIAEFMRPVGVQEELPMPQIIERTGKVKNWDYADTPISIINSETVKAIASAIGTDLNPLTVSAAISSCPDCLPGRNFRGWANASR